MFEVCRTVDVSSSVSYVSNQLLVLNEARKLKLDKIPEKKK